MRNPLTLYRDAISAEGTYHYVQQEFSSDPLPQFTAKTLNRQAKKAQKDENTEKARLKKVISHRRSA
jgi:hypothetical protein